MKHHTVLSRSHVGQWWVEAVGVVGDVALVAQQQVRLVRFVLFCIYTYIYIYIYIYTNDDPLTVVSGGSRQ